MSKAKRILVVDDDDAQLLWSTEVLNKNGYDVHSSKSAEEALDILGSEQYDLIISDLVMPGMSGMDFVRKIAEIREGQKAIIMTGHGDVETFIESVHGLGALEYIVKPIEQDNFVMMVDKLTT